MPLPSQQGRDRPNIDLETHQASLANQGAAPQPSAAPQETPQPSVAPTPQPTAAPEEFAMLRATPTPTPESRPSVAPIPASAYQRYQERTKQSGRITNRGIAAVDAIGTPLGRYRKLLYDSVGSRWYRYVAQRGEMAGIGNAHVAFVVDRNGQVKNLKIIENTSNETFANICLQSIMEVEMPPIPEELATSLPPEGLPEDITFTMFAN
jgi:outer membrane biosynthesis protein TonB